MIKLSVSFVLQLLDDYTGELSDGGHTFQVDGRPARPVRKPGGYYVFLEPRAPCEVLIQSSRYSPMSLRVDPDTLPPENPVVPVRLLRRGDIRFPGCDRLEGCAPPGVTVYAFLPQDPPLTLRGERGGVLTLDGYTPKSLQGLRFSIGKGASREWFVVEEKLPGGGYRIQPPFRRRHRQGEVVERASACLAAPDGRFAICVEPGAVIGEAQYYDEEGKKWVCLSVPAPR